MSGTFRTILTVKEHKQLQLENKEFKNRFNK